ncbi:hypothetical protein [Jannaschia marina]|uniref:hypothetical protein n=1 Tax=Jannaschia marina TaxID=2741674 RepID=UPI0015CCD62C|nr:hypothetical protein [Jannaschia marina]
MTYLGPISDLLLLLGTLGMAGWCIVLTRRLRSFSRLERDVRATVDNLRSQIDAAGASITSATAETQAREAALIALTSAADDRIGRIEMLMASFEDIEAEAADALHSDGGADPVPSFRASRPTDFAAGAAR